MTTVLNELLENKLLELPLFVSYTKIVDKATTEKRVILSIKHNTTQYFVKPFYKMIHPINLNENR
ncbi:hypothetical protein [Flavobacterium sp.]|jgi:hypothetical protein|uniref:hypothetical protein n=1 Tax=Flavobacterium sp. TaxID=239 RepID=UPI0037BE2528